MWNVDFRTHSYYHVSKVFWMNWHALSLSIIMPFSKINVSSSTNVKNIISPIFSNPHFLRCNSSNNLLIFNKLIRLISFGLVSHLISLKNAKLYKLLIYNNNLNIEIKYEWYYLHSITPLCTTNYQGVKQANSNQPPAVCF